MVSDWASPFAKPLARQRAPVWHSCRGNSVGLSNPRFPLGKDHRGAL